MDNTKHETITRTNPEALNSCNQPATEPYFWTDSVQRRAKILQTKEDLQLQHRG